MLVHRLRRWPNIESTLGKYPVFSQDDTVTGRHGVDGNFPGDGYRRLRNVNRIML